MNYINTIILGVIQGLTEFLPISSSGHLVLLQKILPGFNQPGVLFDVVLHLGTLLSVVVYFNKRIYILFRKYFWQIIIATFPAAITGLLLDSFFEMLFTFILYVGFEFLVNAIMSWYVSRSKNRGTLIDYKNSLLIGIAQAISISPGISRSGATIFAATALGIDKKEAAEFSFIISLPAIAGAIVLQILKYGDYAIPNISQYIVGSLMAFIFGLIAIKIVMDFINKGKFTIFAIYSLVLGGIIILLSI